MELGIIGLPKSGKTTVFNALTGSKAETGDFSSHQTAPNVGVIKVPDPRLDSLTGLLKPKRTVPAEITYVDIAVPSTGLGKQEGPRGQYLSQVSNTDALVHVVRAFESDTVPHVEGSVDPERDIATMSLELVFSDMAVIERRLARLKDSLKGAKQQERDAAQREQVLLTRIKSGLEQDVPIREQDIPEQEARELESFRFLTAKPLLLLLNIGEGRLPEASSLESDLRSRHGRPKQDVAVLCGQVEMELSQLGDEDAEEFRASMGVGESGLDRMIQLSYSLLGLVSFFTTASDEVKAWTVAEGTVIQRAAGKIHTDMERGFIRAEVIGYDDLVKCGSMAEARKQGLLRLEGKGYIVKDGDVVTVLFNV